VSQDRHGLRLATWAQARIAILECCVLAVACMVTYWLTTSLLTRVYSISHADDLLGGLWAVVATIFVCRDSYQQSLAAAVSRMAATAVSFVVCLIYLIFLPVSAWSVALLIGVSALAVMLIGRPGDAVTAAITTAVVMIVAAVTPRDAWEQPILRFVDTLIGVAVGVAAAWIGLRLLRPRVEARS
jgi:uncharacterized membrane protein YccC